MSVVLSDIAKKNKFHEYDHSVARSYFLALVVRKDYAHMEQLNSVLLRLVQSGILDHWFAETLYAFNLEHTRTAVAIIDDDGAFPTVSLEQLTVAFGVLAVGAIISSCCFLIELRL